MTWPFDPLRPLSYDLIMADPPWSFALYGENGTRKSAQAQYECMDLTAIAALPVAHLARGNCWLWLWATHPMLPEALSVMRAWGFRFATSGVWCKRGRSGSLAFGTGYVLRCASEPFLIGRFGEPAIGSRSIRTVIEGPRARHSEKPDSAYEAAETLFPALRRADIFSRRNRPGWDSWGSEVGKFDAPAPMLEAAE